MSDKHEVGGSSPPLGTKMDKQEAYNFILDVTDWCHRNGVANREAIRELIAILEMYEAGKPKKDAVIGNYPDYQKLRRDRGLKAQDVATAVGITSVMLSYIENRKTVYPKAQTIQALNKFFGIDEQETKP